jgi:hypothetical protein
MLRNLLLATTAVALPIAAAHAQSQSEMDAIAAGVWAQVMGDQVPECGLNGSGPPVKGSGTCVPLTLAPGDVLPGSNKSLTDKNGNTWSLVCTPNEDGNGCWSGGMVFNGQTVSTGYWLALRLVNGVVYAEQAKGAGWTITDASNPGDSGNTWQYIAGDPGQSTETAQETAAPTSPPAAALNTSPSPLVGQPGGPPGPGSCPVQGAVTPGSGSFSDAAGNTFAIDANNGDVASVNSAPINSGAYQTSQLAQGTDGNIYGQDENSHQWFELMGIGADTWWQPLASVPAAIMPASPTIASATGANPCSGAMPQNTTGQLNPMSGVLPNILQTCADPATIANPMNADLCSKAFANQAMLDQISAQLAAAQQAAAGSK